MSLGGGYMLPSREGHAIAAIGLGITMKTDGKSTRDAYSLFEYAIPARTDGPPPHLHTREDESFICLAGELDVTSAARTSRSSMGDYLYLPRDVVHTFRNTYDEEARVISVVSPAGLEAYYQALADMPPGPKDIGKMKKIMADFGLVAAAAARGALTMRVGIIGAGVAGLPPRRCSRRPGTRSWCSTRRPTSAGCGAAPGATPG